MSFTYSKQTSKSPADAMAAVEAALTARRFSVLWHLDMSGTLESKGFSGHGETHIMEVCNAARANEALRLAPESAYLLPCKVLVQAREEGSEVGLLLPSALVRMAGVESAEMTAFATDVEGDLRAAIDEAAR